MPDETAMVVACLTPPGRAAIATLGLAGPAAWEAARALFRPRPPQSLPATPHAGQFWLGRCGDDVADEVVLAVRESTLEIHCHGGRAVVEMLVTAFSTRGVRAGTWQEFLRHTSVHLRAEAAIALAHAATTRTAAILLDQYQGAFAGAVADVLAALERGETLVASALLGKLARWSALGRRLTEPWRVAVAGAPNVGKSSLVNALAGYQRSIVSPTPGTTRDVVTARIAVDGWPVELSDTAGLRDGAASLEGQGIAQARETAAAADLCLWVLDASAEPIWPEQKRQNVRMVVNKVDLPAAWILDRAGNAVRVSAATGEGLADLCAALAQWLVPEVPPAGAAVPFTPSLCDAIEAAERHFDAGAAAEARRVLRALSDSSREEQAP